MRRIMITQQTVFNALFLALDASPKDQATQPIASFLVDANPYIWRDGGSADPAIFVEFKRFAEENGFKNPLPERESYKLAENYVKMLGSDFYNAFISTVDETAWVQNVQKLQSELG